LHHTHFLHDALPISLIICTHLYTSSKELYKATGANLIPLVVLKSWITFFCFNALHILAASGCSIKTCAPRSALSIGLQITKRLSTLFITSCSNKSIM